MLSACVIALDEAERLPACLASLAFCDEVVVVDSGSTDRTQAIARAAGARVVEHPWAGFPAQRNVALDHASGDWILEVDADERITPELAAELRAFLAGPPAEEVDMGMLPMRHEFLGALLGPSGHYPFSRPRLFRRVAYRHDEARAVHEGLSPRRRPWVARHDMHHVLATSLGEALRDTWRYARLEADELAGAGPPRSWLVALVVRPAVKFAYGLVALGGWRDGWRGVLRLGLDSASDVLVWARHLARRPRGEPVGGHYGADETGAGPTRLVAIGGAAAVADARGWLREREAAGDWVTVVTYAPAAADGLDVEAVPRLGPFHLLRALDAQRQLAPFDAVAPLDRRARALVRPMPGRLRGARTVAPGA